MTAALLRGAVRGGLLQRAIALERLTVGYNALEGVVATAAGLAAGSVALTGFGVDSGIEVTSAVGNHTVLRDGDNTRQREDSN